MRIGLLKAQEDEIRKHGETEAKRKLIENKYQIIYEIFRLEGVLDDAAKRQNITTELKKVFYDIDKYKEHFELDVPDSILIQFSDVVNAVSELRDDLYSNEDYFNGTNLSRLGRKRIRKAMESFNSVRFGKYKI